MSKTFLAASVSAVMGFGLGIGAAFLVLKQRLEAEYQERLRAEIVTTRKYLLTTVNREYETPMDAVKALIPDAVVGSLLEPGQTPPKTDYTKFAKQRTEEAPPKEGEMRAAEASTEDEWKIRNDENRVNGRPYVISAEEFAENDGNYAEATLTYYEGDTVLADEQERDVPDINETVGTENLSCFGILSNDPNVVYVRNDKLNLLFEIVWSGGKYRELVLGLTD